MRITKVSYTLLHPFTGAIALATVAMAVCVSSPAFCADSSVFIRTHVGVHQLTDGTAQVMNAEEDGIAGIFIRSGEPIDIQSFSPAEIDPATSETVFIKYDPKTNRYTEMILGSKSVRIVGNFSVQVGRVRIGVDNVNPYLSVVSGNAVVGFLGTGLIVNNDKAALLEANQFSSYREIFKPYILSKGEILLNGKPLRSDVVGLTLEQPKNSCLPGSDAVFLKGEDLARVKRAKDKQERIALLDRLLKKRDWDPYKKNVLIIQVNSDPGAVVGINYEEGNVQQISKLSTTATSKKVCVVDNLPLK